MRAGRGGWPLLVGLASLVAGAAAGREEGPPQAPATDVLRGPARPKVPAEGPAVAAAPGVQGPQAGPAGNDLPLILPPLPDAAPGTELDLPTASGGPGVSTTIDDPGGLPEIHPPVSSEDLVAPDLGPLPGELEPVDRGAAPKRPSVTSRPAGSSRSQTIPSAGRPRRGLLGGFLNRALGRPSPAPRPVAEPDEDDEFEGKSVEELDDPKSRDELARKRIEREVIRVVGDRIRELTVTVDGQRVEIRASATRFYVRRGVRRSIEELPSLRGFNASVEVN